MGTPFFAFPPVFFASCLVIEDKGRLRLLVPDRIARRGPADSSRYFFAAALIFFFVLPPSFASASTTRFELLTQPKMPPCALIMRSA